MHLSPLLLFPLGILNIVQSAVIPNKGRETDSVHKNEDQLSIQNEMRESQSQDTLDLDEGRNSGQKLMVIILDGYRWDYYEKQKEKSELPGLSKFVEGGVRAKWVNPETPSISFPNGHSLSTGLHVESHGITGNEMLNFTKPQDEALVSLSSLNSTREDEWWQIAEPIWTTVEKNGKKSYCYRWSRCDIPFRGQGKILASADSTGYFGIPMEQELETFTLGLNKGLEKLNADTDFAIIYSEYADTIGHGFGPDSPEMHQAIVDMDNVFFHFLEKLESDHPRLKEKLNIIVTGDHGMTKIAQNSETKYIVLENFLNVSDVAALIPSRQFIGFLPAPGRFDHLYTSLKGVSEGLDVYKKEEIPTEWHFKDAKFALPLYAVARPGYVFIKWTETAPSEKGYHGWPSELVPDMRAIFYANGPSFKKNVVLPPIEIVDIYQIYTRVLNISPMPHNGTWESVKDMFV